MWVRMCVCTHPYRLWVPRRQRIQPQHIALSYAHLRDTVLLHSKQLMKPILVPLNKKRIQ